MTKGASLAALVRRPDGAAYVAASQPGAELLSSPPCAPHAIEAGAQRALKSLGLHAGARNAHCKSWPALCCACPLAGGGGSGAAEGEGGRGGGRSPPQGAQGWWRWGGPTWG